MRFRSQLVNVEAAKVPAHPFKPGPRSARAARRQPTNPAAHAFCRGCHLALGNRPFLLRNCNEVVAIDGKAERSSGSASALPLMLLRFSFARSPSWPAFIFVTTTHVKPSVLRSCRPDLAKLKPGGASRRTSASAVEPSLLVHLAGRRRPAAVPIWIRTVERPRDGATVIEVRVVAGSRMTSRMRIGRARFMAGVWAGSRAGGAAPAQIARDRRECAPELAHHRQVVDRLMRRVIKSTRYGSESRRISAAGA
jgi:hypothetical protein